ncbi:response regulator transcription factor [Oscillatoria sp. CS-180]|uniref:response regulator n=1 Tax=Oscillatoria sp. CS-180 TaxID=3021720 RepID=UPI00232ED266|nr:response regulator transcription factor [Oscillatoria sp. CS-180]MDB9527289.1 response regulator transcription factor [Oscillatoria sp. CS-180]
MRIVIVEDDPVMQLGLEQFLANYDHFQVVGRAEDGYSGIAATLTLKPDLVVMDIGLPQLDGIAATQQIKQQSPNTRVVMLTSHTADVEMIAALASGADAYCIKGTSLEQLEIALSCAQNGAAYLDPQIARQVIGHLQYAHPPCPEIDLSKRELDVLRLIVEGKSNPEIASELFLSISTVKTHLRSIMNKLSVDDRVQAAVAALRGGLV